MILLSTTENKPALDERVLKLLNAKGYEVIRKLGEGNTREVFLVTYHQGPLRQERVVKIPKSEIDVASPTTVMNRSKGDLDAREAATVSRLNHPNVIGIYDVISDKERTITIEEYFEGISLDELIAVGGPIKDPEIFRARFGAILAGLRYLHESDIAHRDIKPSNILIRRDGNIVKIADLQNAGPAYDGERSFLPTRGGTAFTDPQLLHQFMHNEATRASIQNDLYALGATAYFALTGKKPVDIAMVSSSEGKKVKIGDKEVGVALTESGTTMLDINTEEHRKKVKKALKDVPRQYRKMVGDLLMHPPEVTSRYQVGHVYSNLEHALDQATRPWRWIDWKKIRNYAAGFVVGSTAIAGFMGGCELMRREEISRRWREPTTFEMLNRSIFEDGGLEYLLKEPNREVLATLQPVYGEIRERVADVDRQYKLDRGRTAIEVAVDIHRMSERLASAVIRSALMEPKQNKQQEYGSKRVVLTLVPTAIAFEDEGGLNAYFKSIAQETTEPYLAIGHSVRYIKRCIGTNSTLADVCTQYFCDSVDEVFKARQQAGHTEYFQKIVEDGTILPGYREFLSPTKRSLIDRAIALYSITDPKGDVHLEVLGDNNIPMSGLDAK